jgi:hypothetical protein
VTRVAIGLRVDRNGADAHSPSGLDDPASDFAAIRDQDFRNMGGLMGTLQSKIVCRGRDASTVSD